MSAARAIRLVAAREIRERVRTREFRASTAIQVAIVIAIVVVIGVTSGSHAETYEVGAVGAGAEEVVAAAEAGQDPLGIELKRQTFASPEAAEAAVADDEVDAAVADGGLIVAPNPPDELVALLEGAARELGAAERLRDEGLSSDAIAEALRAPGLELREVGEAGEGGEGLAFLASLLLFAAIIGFGLYLATGVVEEKSSRVVELVLAAIRPIHLLSGKVAGIGLLGLAQVLVIAGAGVITALAMGSVTLPASTARTVVLVAVFFVLGYLLYASAFAVAGAIVSRAEDVQTSTAPLTLILVVGYVVAVNLVGSPGSGAAAVFTLVPATAPMVVPMRAAQDALPAWELALSIVLVVAATAALIWLATRIYERTVLRMGAPLRFAQALRLARRGDRSPA